MKRYVNNREGDEIKRGTLMFLNFKLTHNQKTENYIELFKKYLEEDPIVHLSGDKYVSINSLSEDEILTKDGYPIILYGKIATYDILDQDAFYDKKKKEPVSVTIGENVVANFKSIDFYFSPECHRLVFFDNQPVKYKQVSKYFSEAGAKILGEGQINVTFETDRDIIERILHANCIESFKAVISYSNRDESSSFSKLIEEKTKGDNAERLEIVVKPAKNEEMQAQPDGLISSTTELAQSNGYVIAIIREGEMSKRTRIDTTEHPLKESFTSKASELRNTIHLILMTKFRSKTKSYDRE
jgi:hypothetical protein